MADRLRLTEKGGQFLREWLSGDSFIMARTSGSTGKPKEIRLPKSDMRASARATNRFFGIGRDSFLLCPLSADYIAGKMMIVRALEAGCGLLMTEPSNHLGNTINKIAAEYGLIDLLPLVPSQCESSIAETDCRAIRNIIVGGAPVSPETEKQLTGLPCSVWATYGMTETCSHVAVRPMGSPLYEAMPGISFSADEDGKLAIIAPEYSFSTLPTNDVVELADSRHFRWLGRADNVVNSGGIKIFPEQLERELAPLIPFPFYFKGEPDAKWGTRLVLVAHCRRHEAERLARLCRHHLPPYSVPKDIRCVEKIPATANGKIRRV